MSRFTPVVAGLLLLGAYPIFAQDISVEDTVNFDLRAIGQTQGAGVPNAVGLGAFVPLHKTSNAVTYVDVEVKGNVADRSGDSSIINTEVAGTTPSSSTRLGYRWLNPSGQMYGVYAGYDTRELKAGPVDTTVVVTDPRTVDFQQAALGAEFVSNQWRFDVYALIPTGDTEQQVNSHYQGGALDTYGADVGYQINDKTKVTVGYYHQNGDVGEASGSGASAGLNYEITNNLTAGLKVSYDDAFETRVMATINWSFADLFKGDEAEKETTTNMVMKALNASPEQRDVRVHDGCQRVCQIAEACIGPSRPGTGDAGCQLGTRMVDYQNTYINGHWVTADVACKADTGKPCIPCFARCGSTSTSGCAERESCQ
jgi:hypothetical protein